jgi:hypothetical protein
MTDPNSARAVCAFCARQSTRENPMTKEHALPAWTSKTIRDAVGITSRRTLPFFATFRGVRHERRELGEPVRDVCHECNTGWLAQDVENPAIPYVSAMIIAQPIELDPRAQTLIAAWSYKTALNLDRTTVRPALPLTLAHEFFATRAPVEHAVIDVAAYNGPVPYTLETVTGPYATLIAFSVGRAAFRTVWCAPPHVITELPFDNPDDDPRQARLRMCPAPGEAVNWPPPHIIEDREGLRNFGSILLDGQRPDEEQMPPR